MKQFLMNLFKRDMKLDMKLDDMIFNKFTYEPERLLEFLVEVRLLFDVLPLLIFNLGVVAYWFIVVVHVCYLVHI